MPLGSSWAISEVTEFLLEIKHRSLREYVVFNVPPDTIGHFRDEFYRPDDQTTVSYTHLTLPTILRV